MTGGTLGMIASQLTSAVTADHRLFAIIGMGAVAGAVLGAYNRALLEAREEEHGDR